MTRLRLLLPVVLAGALIAGCDKNDNNKAANPPPKAPTTSDVKSDMQKAGDQAKGAAGSAAEATSDAAKTAADKTKSAASDAANSTKNAAGNAADAVKNAADTAKTNTADAVTDVKAQVTDWYAKAQDALKNNKLDEAKVYVEKLESFKSKLSADWQAKIDAFQKTYQAARAKAETNLNK
jgi:hypothetical protein